MTLPSRTRLVVEPLQDGTAPVLGVKLGDAGLLSLKAFRRLSTSAFRAPKRSREFEGRKSKKEMLQHTWVTLAMHGGVADLIDDFNEHKPDVEEKSTWHPEQSDRSTNEYAHDCALVKQDKSSIKLPNEAYSGAIIGGCFQLGALIEEHESPGERTYAVNDLRAPERRLVARIYNLAELSGKCRDARKRHMKRLIRRENVCDIQQDGKRYIVYPLDTSSFPSAAKHNTAHSRTQHSTWQPESPKEFQNVTEFPPLSTKGPQTESKVFWKTSEVQRFFQIPRKQGPPAPSVVRSPTTADDHESLESGQISVPKRKRHRWRKAKKDDIIVKYTAAEPEESGTPPSADATIGDVGSEIVRPSFGSRIEMDKYLELNAEKIINMAAEVEHFDLNSIKKSLGADSSDDFNLRAEVIETMARWEQWLTDDLSHVRELLLIMHQHFQVQKRREEIDHLVQKEELLGQQEADKRSLERRLRVRLMKKKEGKAKERLKEIHKNIRVELDNISVALTVNMRERQLYLGSWFL